MIFIIFRRCLFSLLCLTGLIISVRLDSYLNLCNFNGNDSATEIEDGFEKIICDCEKVTFCFAIELSEEYNVTTIKLHPDVNTTFSNQPYCEILPLEAQVNTPGFEFLPQIGREMLVRIFTDSDYGRYKVVCNIFEIPDEFNSIINIEWEIVNVTPTVVLVDTEVKLQLTVMRQSNISSPALWCFVNTPDNNTEILLTSWVSSNHVNCSAFNPTVPGVFMVSLGSFMSPSIFKKAVSIKILSKPPVALEAKYNFDFSTIFILFDENIEIHSTCADVFSRQTQEYLGVGFKCHIRGNSLAVKVGSHFKMIDDVEINFKNKICRAGSLGTEFCLSTPSSSLPVSKPKILEPNLSLYISPICEGNSKEKYVSLKIIPTPQESPKVQNQNFQIKSFGKTHRKNIIMWRIWRQFQSKLSSRHLILQMNGTDVAPLVENISVLENIVNVDVDAVVSTVKVIVTVKSFPFSSSIMAEADITICKGLEKLFRYVWFRNEENVLKDGSFVIMKNLTPGKYVIRCMVIAYNSSEILGEGWTTTEILASEERILIIPSEVTVGEEDEIFLQAVTLQGSAISWICRTSFDTPCVMTNKKLVSEMFDLNSPNISISGGSLPVGDYIWTAKSARGLNNAKVFIYPGNLSAISVKIPSVFVKASEEVVLFGIVKEMERNCRAWWSSVREKGFSYYKIPEAGPLENLVGVQYPLEEVPLVILPLGNLKGLEFDLFYMFKFQVFCPQSGSLAYTTVPLIKRIPPFVSPLIVQPLKGKAMITNFVISGGNVDVSHQNYPLNFEWSYVDLCDVAFPIKRGAFSKNFTTYLPPGELKLVLKVCDRNELCTTISSPTINVIQAFEFPAENFRYARSRIQYLMGSGDVLEAFGLIVTVLKSLALLAEPEIRQEIFSSVEEVIKMKINDLSKKMSSSSNAPKLSLDFFDRAENVVKYFRKGSAIMNLLTEFKKSILKTYKEENV